MKLITDEINSNVFLIKAVPTTDEEKRGTVKLTLPDDITYIGNYAFKEFADSLVQIKLPKSLKEIGTGAFMNCRKLCGINIPKGTRRIHDLAFCNCENLRYVNLPQSLEILILDCFDECNLLDKIEIPKGVRFGEEAFKWKNVPSGFRLIFNAHDEQGKEFKLSIPITEKYAPKSKWALFFLNIFIEEPCYANFKAIKGGVVFRYPIAIAYLKRSKWAWGFVRTNIENIGRYLIYNNDAAALNDIFNHMRYKGRLMIDKLLDYAIETQKTEAAAMLMQYKQKIGSYDRKYVNKRFDI